MNGKKNRPVVPVTLEGLNKKLDVETKRLVREKEEGIVKWISKKAVLNGNSVLVFKDKTGTKITMSYRLDKDGNLRFARENQMTNILPQNHTRPSAAHFGRTSRDIES